MSSQEPLETLVASNERPDVKSKHFLNNEPALAHFYAMLREKIEKTPGDRTQLLSPKNEHHLVMRSAMNYARSGCFALALELGEFNCRTHSGQLDIDNLHSSELEVFYTVEFQAVPQ